MPMHVPFEYRAECDRPLEMVEVEPRGDALPGNLRDRVLVFTVHDGDWLPPHFIKDADGKPRVEPLAFHDRYVSERDWGANLVAGSIASSLGLRGFARVNVARVLLDFNRFPGSTPPGNRDPLERLAINDPFSSILGHDEKMEVLGLYDRISDLFEEHWLSGNILMLGVHTYDPRNQTQTIRPDLSLVTCSATYLRESRMPYGVFDPLYSDVLAESTCSRVLRDRISLDLERARFRVLHNHPYALPEGSVEVRAQVWYFFDYLRRRYTEACPETRDCPAHGMVWSMLLNTNLRIHEAETLRGFLHRFRRLPPSEEQRYRAAQEAYERVQRFLDASTVLTDYRRSRERPSCMAMEVRKDLLFDIDPKTGHPGPLTAPNVERAQRIGEVIAGAIRTYFDQDRAIG